MNKLLLEILLQITGITAASGIHYQNEKLYVVSDESDYLYEYQLTANELKKHALTDNPQELRSKQTKRDYEAIAANGTDLYLFGSGSKPNRELVTQFNTQNQAVQNFSLDLLYPSIASFAEINPDELNIEGALFRGDDLLLFNRGNGANNKNFIVTVQGKNFTEEFNIFIQDIKLPQLNGINTGFSDAVLVGDKIYFLATAEGGSSTYNDGQIAGTLFGCIDTKRFKVKYTEVLSNDKKLEGLTVLNQDKKNITFLLCEDSDDSTQNVATIYKLNIKK
ncbi:hypothetical protein K5I29_07195 [Flavobacterium agricola]|uniref:Uncharacterized protein n=1 Tax=Flavobacterium agricola TaxID=2870839 RepID=A0ABY6LZN7_9FLAO|nr:hypothetical protein [Flavobacterium agricola]UYW00358.1 hypothetical protein K5I29_07195 [Flavobacterium agricola]